MKLQYQTLIIGFAKAQFALKYNDNIEENTFPFLGLEPSSRK